MPTDDERTMAALAHAGAILNYSTGGVGGIICAGIIWATQQEKSPWVAFQALQSLVFQAVCLILTALIIGVPWILGFLVSFITLGLGTLIAVPIMITVLFVGLTIGAGGTAYALYGAYQIYTGKEFMYYWIGPWLQQRLSRPDGTPPPA